MNRMAVLGVVGMVFLAGCAAADDGADESDDALKAPAFVGKGTAAVTIGNQAATDLGVSTQVAKYMHDSSTLGQEQAVTFAAGAFKLPTSAFAGGKDPGGPTHPTPFDLMFRTLADVYPQMASYFPEFSTANDNLSCVAVNDARTLTTVFRGFEGYKEVLGVDGRTAAERTTLDKNAKAAVASFTKGTSGHSVDYLSCHWDNTDDTSADALIRIDDTSSEFRVLLAFVGS